MDISHHKKTKNTCNLFSVHVANVPWDTEEEELMNIFSTVSTNGPPSITIVPFQKTCFTTYAFVKYRTRKEADNAVQTYNGIKFGRQILNITIATHTKDKRERKGELKNPQGMSKFDYNQRQPHGASKWKYDQSKSNCPNFNESRGRQKCNTKNKKRGKSILREDMPRREPTGMVVKAGDEHSINHRLRANLRSLVTNKEVAGSYGIDDPKEFLQDFRDVCVEMQDVPYGVTVNPIQFRIQEMMKKSDLEDLIIRYYNDNDGETPFKNMDVDISGNKLLTNEQFENLFPGLT